MADGEGSPPPEVAHVWGWFWSLNARRSAGFQPNPISYCDIAAWAALMGARPSPWEVWLITRLDDAFLTRKPGTDPERPNEAPAGEGPEAVKALFSTLANGPRNADGVILKKRPKPSGGVGKIAVEADKPIRKTAGNSAAAD